MASLYIGTSAITAAGWEGSFYPEGTKPAEYLSYYATQFKSVEIDSTFYRTPAEATVRGWERKTPDAREYVINAPFQNQTAVRKKLRETKGWKDISLPSSLLTRTNAKPRS